MSEQEQIDEILREADSYGLKNEVTESAIREMECGCNALLAHEIGFGEWIK